MLQDSECTQQICHNLHGPAMACHCWTNVIDCCLLIFVPGGQNMADADAVNNLQIRQNFGERSDVEGDRMMFI